MNWKTKQINTLIDIVREYPKEGIVWGYLYGLNYLNLNKSLS